MIAYVYEIADASCKVESYVETQWSDELSTHQNISAITHCCEIVRVIVTRREQKRTEVEKTIYSPNMERINKLNAMPYPVVVEKA